MASGFKLKLHEGEMSRAEAIRAVRDGRLKRRSLLELDRVIDEMVARQIEAEFGPRCPDYEPECVVCQSWRAFDEMKK